MVRLYGITQAKFDVICDGIPGRVLGREYLKISDS